MAVVPALETLQSFLLDQIGPAPLYGTRRQGFALPAITLAVLSLEPLGGMGTQSLHLLQQELGHRRTQEYRSRLHPVR